VARAVQSRQVAGSRPRRQQAFPAGRKKTEQAQAEETRNAERRTRQQVSSVSIYIYWYIHMVTYSRKYEECYIYIYMLLICYNPEKYIYIIYSRENQQKEHI